MLQFSLKILVFIKRFYKKNQKTYKVNPLWEKPNKCFLLYSLKLTYIFKFIMRKESREKHIKELFIKSFDTCQPKSIKTLILKIQTTTRKEHHSWNIKSKLKRLIVLGLNALLKRYVMWLSMLRAVKIWFLNL